jgi:hypothetical protein
VNDDQIRTKVRRILGVAFVLAMALGLGAYLATETWLPVDPLIVTVSVVGVMGALGLWRALKVAERFPQVYPEVAEQYRLAPRAALMATMLLDLIIAVIQFRLNLS